MSASRIDRAHHYRERAEQLRAVAEAACLMESRAILTRLAADYEKMAASIEVSETGRKTEVKADLH
jgi:hypothetical protein